ncbi:RXLR domain-containing protein [Phytophthora infestans]|uniref:RxLR effector protein n=1 Tax=Phytophthora infestans TaxID=4787 RepID=A0A833T8F7_PHYIN|nr:RXLR domain-containing protein [Phytophthora infestans]KAI9982070.1 hypothetical protein PInf_007958 [Phytophthora infestans]
MRVSSYLLVVAASFLASCDGVSATSRTKLSAASPADVEPSVDVGPAKSVRFLRGKLEQPAHAQDTPEEERSIPSFKLIDDVLQKYKVDMSAVKRLQATQSGNVNKLVLDVNGKLKTFTDVDIKYLRQKLKNPDIKGHLQAWKKAEANPVVLSERLRKAGFAKDITVMEALGIYKAQMLRKNKLLTLKNP